MFQRVIQRARRAWLRVPAIAQALFKGWRNAPTYPLILQIEHIGRCNLKCVMCVHGRDGRGDVPDMTLEQFTSLLGQFKGANAAPGFDHLCGIVLQGIGEPLLHPQAIPMLRYAHDQGLLTGMVTNLTILTDRTAEELVSLGMDYLTISVDAIDPQTFADIRRGAHFDVLPRVLGNIEKLHAAKLRLGSERPEISVLSLLMKRTLAQIPELVSRLRAIGVQKISFCDVVVSEIPADMRFSDGSRCADETLLGLPKEERMRIMRDIKALDSSDCQVEVPEDWGGISQQYREDAVLTCDDLWDKPFVTVEGIVTPCCYAPAKELLPMGDLNKQSFEEIWFGETYRQLRWQHLTTRGLPHICFHCRQRVKVAARNVLRLGAHGTGLTPRGQVFLGKESTQNNISTSTSFPRRRESRTL